MRKKNMGFTDSFLDDLCSRLPDYLKIEHNIDANSNKPFRCLFGTHEDRSPSMYYYGDSHSGHPVCYCYGCHQKADILDLVAVDFGLTGADGVRKAAEIVGLDADKGRDPMAGYDKKDDKNIGVRPWATRPKGKPPAKEKPILPDYDFTSRTQMAADALHAYTPNDLTAVRTAWQKARAELQNNDNQAQIMEKTAAVLADGGKLTDGQTAALVYTYLRARGLSDDTIRAAQIGLAVGGPKEITQDYKDIEIRMRKQGLYKITFPFFSGEKCHYFISETLMRGQLDGGGGKYFKPPMHGRPQAYYHEDYISAPPEVLYICEGVYDALSIEQTGRKALALIGTSHRRLIELLDEHKDGFKNAVIVIALDADDAGEMAAADLGAELDRLEIAHVRGKADGGKDYSECLEKDPARLEDQLQTVDGAALEIRDAAMYQAEKKKQDEETDYLKKSAAYFLTDFCAAVQDAPKHPPIATGFKKLDDTLAGGLHRQWLYIIGGMSSVGKTAAIMQIADHIAAAGTDVIIISLEMSKFELMARSVSRETLLESVRRTGDAVNAKTAAQIIDGRVLTEGTEDDKKTYDEAVGNYFDYALNVYIIEGSMKIGIDQITQIVDDHIRITGRMPVLIVDYLQIMAPWDPRATDKQNADHAVSGLKTLARDRNIPVIAVSSFNRMSYNGGADMASFKETGSIEYDADVLIAIQLAGMDNTDSARSLQKNADDAGKAGEAVKIQLKVLKNRHGAKEDCFLYYYTRFNYFTEDEAEVRSGRLNGWNRVDVP